MADSGEAIVFEAADPVSAAELANARPRRQWLRPALMLSVPLLLAAIGLYFWLASGRYVSTDNAYVQQDKVSVSADVGGRIVEVGVHENQRVKAGDLLFRIDPDPYRIAVAQADAAIAGAQVEVATMQSGYASTSVDIAAAREDIRFAEQDHDRQRELMNRGFTTRARLQQAEHALAVARESLRTAQADAAEARSKLATGAAVPGQNPAIASARAQRDKAMLDYARTLVRAPVSGMISQADRLQIGQMMISGLPAVSIVANSTGWVEANFKETDLAHMRVGQPAEIRLDAYPDRVFSGHVASIGAGTGSEFSVLPAQNANGNWVKVTQRVPVRIAIDTRTDRPMIAGLSAHVTIDTEARGQR